MKNLDQKIINKLSSNLNFFRFKKFEGDYLLTNDFGKYIFLTESEFREFIYGKLNKNSSIYKDLIRNGFIYQKEKVEELVEKYQKKYSYLFQGPSLHIIVLTLRCNHKCIYCQTSSRPKNFRGVDMTIETAKRVVDTIFMTPSHFLAIEFQGGEPLFNWGVLRFIVEYSRKKNKKKKKNLQIRLVSNFTLLNKEKVDYLFKNGVVFSTSLDGPEKVHNKNRIWTEGNSYKKTINWLKFLLRKYKKYYVNQPGALTTITRFSLPYYKEIIDEYVKLGLDNIFLRPLTPLGMARKTWSKIGYSPEDFLNFYKKSLDYIFFLNSKKGIRFRELTAFYIAVKMLTDKDPNFLDLRSPCGAGTGQLLYNYNGDVYTCDEGRMTGDDAFKIGNVFKNNYRELIDSEVVKTVCLSSCLEGLPVENDAYKPYLGVCPVVNYAESGNIFAQIPNSNRYKVLKGIIDYLFEKIRNSDKFKVMLKKWLKGRKF